MKKSLLALALLTTAVILGGPHQMREYEIAQRARLLSPTHKLNFLADELACLDSCVDRAQSFALTLNETITVTGDTLHTFIVGTNVPPGLYRADLSYIVTQVAAAGPIGTAQISYADEIGGVTRAMFDTIDLSLHDRGSTHWCFYLTSGSVVCEMNIVGYAGGTAIIRYRGTLTRQF